MKTLKNILIGVCSLLFYYFASHLILLWGHNDKYAIVQVLMFYVLPILPGFALAFLLVRNSLIEFLNSWGVSFFSSLCVFFIWLLLRVDLKIYTSLSGFEEFSLGEGVLLAAMSFLYIVSCTIGCIIAAIVSCCRQRKRTKG